MPKINQEEYKRLREIESNKKYLARDAGGMLHAFRSKPTLCSEGTWSDGRCAYRKDPDKFEFILQKDKHYSIAELIEEYEHSLNKATPWTPNPNDFESEETEVSKQKLIDKWEGAIEVADFYGKGKEERLISYMKEFVHDLNQLDEPEVLSSDWISEKSIDTHVDTLSGEVQVTFRLDDLENLLLPEQEKVKLDKEDIENIQIYKKNGWTLSHLIDDIGVDAKHDELLARAWLDGFEVKKEPKYYAKVKGHELMTPKHLVVYWNYHIKDETLRVSTLRHSEIYKTRMTLQEWNDLGINNNNADFEGEGS